MGLIVQDAAVKTAGIGSDRIGAGFGWLADTALPNLLHVRGTPSIFRLKPSTATGRRPERRGSTKAQSVQPTRILLHLSQVKQPEHSPEARRPLHTR